MILPKKHLSVNESLFGFGAFLLPKLKEPTSLDSLWENYRNAYANKEYPVKFSFDQLVMTLDYLYIIGAIKLSEGGSLCYEVD